MRVAAHGKWFQVDGATFGFRGITYEASTAAAAETGAESRFGIRLAQLAAAGYTVACLPASTAPEPEQAAASGLRFILDLREACPDALAVASRRHRARHARELATRIRRVVRQWEGDDALLGVTFAPAPDRCPDRGAEAWRPTADALVAALHDEDAGLLAAWQSSSPLDAECPPEFDFLIAGCELSDRERLRSTLMAFHAVVGDRPLVVSGAPPRAAEERPEADMAWVVDTALRCGAAGTIAPPNARSQPHGCDSETAAVNRRGLRDLETRWPSITVVINAYNAQDTLEECLSHCAQLEYPDLEVIVVDDGSTDATPAIARAHAGVRLVTTPHSGLSAGRNVGYECARGELIAYLDADAYPSPEWPWFLALAALENGAGGCGGPNLPPPRDPASARIVARSPGGPVPQLLGPDRAAHLPGCNMAFWRWLLERLDGFDPVLEGAEDVELQWRVLEAGQQLAYHPAAVVWHHRRPGLRPYLRQQRHYGRSQAILEHRCPDRFPTGYRMHTALERLRGRGAVGGTGAGAGTGTRAGAGAHPYPVRYLTLPRPEPAALELAHQWGMPAALVAGLTAPLAVVRRRLAAPAAAGAVFAATLFAIDLVLAGRGRRRAERALSARAGVAGFRLLRPLAFRWGHITGSYELRRTPIQSMRRPSGLERPAPAQHCGDRPEQDREVEQDRPPL